MTFYMCIHTIIYFSDNRFLCNVNSSIICSKVLFHFSVNNTSDFSQHFLLIQKAYSKPCAETFSVIIRTGLEYHIHQIINTKNWSKNLLNFPLTCSLSVFLEILLNLCPLLVVVSLLPALSVSLHPTCCTPFTEPSRSDSEH